MTSQWEDEQSFVREPVYELRSQRGPVNEGHQPQTSTFGNRLLDQLSRDEAARLAPYLRRVFLHRGQELAKAGDPFEHLLFPVDALVWTWINSTDTDRPTSLLTVGRRGVVGAARTLEGAHDANVVVLSPGGAWRMHPDAMEVLEATSPLRSSLARFLYKAFLVSSCRLACNSEHNVDRRLARWLLWIVDETGKPEVSLTHQQLADVAAIRRPSVSLAFSDLQRRGVVRVHHGLVQILDRERLERETCHCYYAISDIVNQ